MDLRIKALAGIFVIACVWTPPGRGQQVSPKSSPTRVVQLNGIDIATFLAAMAAEYEITIGLEVDPSQPRSPLTVDLRDVNFQQILDGMVKAKPRYRWRENDGSIEVFPVDRGSSLLDTHFEITLSPF